MSLPFNIEVASDEINKVIISTPLVAENPFRIKLCMEDARTPQQVHMLSQWCSKFKALEGKKLVSVTWEKDPDPKRHYIRHLVIATE